MTLQGHFPYETQFALRNVKKDKNDGKFSLLITYLCKLDAVIRTLRGFHHYLENQNLRILIPTWSVLRVVLNPTPIWPPSHTFLHLKITCRHGPTWTCLQRTFLDSVMCRIQKSATLQKSPLESASLHFPWFMSRWCSLLHWLCSDSPAAIFVRQMRGPNATIS